MKAPSLAHNRPYRKPMVGPILGPIIGPIIGPPLALSYIGIEDGDCGIFLLAILQKSLFADPLAHLGCGGPAAGTLTLLVPFALSPFEARGWRMDTLAFSILQVSRRPGLAHLRAVALRPVH